MTSAAAEEKLSVLLSSPDFSVSEYLNVALSGSNDEELQRRMAELALQLQLQTQSCHEDIGRIGAELQAILPRCAADLGRVGVGLEGLRLDANTLLDETSLLQNAEVSSSLETLSTLHALRSNLGQTKDILQAAATWDTTLQSLAPLLANQNLTEAVAALAQLENGERALRGMPSGRAERQGALEQIRQQVQVMLQPQLQHALQSMQTRLAPLQQCVGLYQSLDKMDVLKSEYIKNRPSLVHKAWFSYRGDETLIGWLPGWYDNVLGLMTEERRQALAVFGPDAAPEMIANVCFSSTAFFVSCIFHPPLTQLLLLRYSRNVSVRFWVPLKPVWNNCTHRMGGFRRQATAHSNQSARFTKQPSSFCRWRTKPWPVVGTMSPTRPMFRVPSFTKICPIFSRRLRLRSNRTKFSCPSWRLTTRVLLSN